MSPEWTWVMSAALHQIDFSLRGVKWINDQILLPNGTVCK
jgi:hypothetical protein